MLGQGESMSQRQSLEHSWQTLNRLMDAAERFVNHTPRLKRLEAERLALLDAIRQAQLLLSVKHLPHIDPGPPVLSQRQARNQGGRSSRR